MPQAYVHTGDCPRCGAPVFAVSEKMEDVVLTGAERREFAIPMTVVKPPSVHYTCDCRAYMPGGIAGMGEGDPDETVDNADRKTMARRREQPEQPSVERAD